MGAFTSALALAGIGLTVYGQAREGQQAQQAANYNAAVYREQAAVIDVKKGLSAQQWDRMIKRLSGATVSAVAASGYDLSGSFLAVMNDRLTQANLDKQTDNYNLEVSKSQSISAADEAQREGSRRRTSSLISAGATLLTQGNEWYSKYGPTPTEPGK